MRQDKKAILQELEELPDDFVGEVLNFIRFLKEKHLKAKIETALLSEATLGKDWLRPEEDEAWQDV